MKDKALAQSKVFWSALEKADVSGMQAVADPKCMFVHIGVTCGMEEEMRCFTDKIFIPTKVVLDSQQAQVFGDTAIATHSELMAKRGDYYSLYSMQSSYYEP